LIAKPSKKNQNTAETLLRGKRELLPYGRRERLDSPRFVSLNVLEHTPLVEMKLGKTIDAAVLNRAPGEELEKGPPADI